MVTKKKTLFFLALALALALALIYKDKNIIRCDSEQIVKVESRKINAYMDSVISILLYKDNTGVVKIIGAIEESNKLYDLNRSLYFTYEYENDTKTYKVIVKKEVINNTDSTPSDLYHTYFLPEKPGVDFFVTMKRLKKNSVLVSGLAHPYFICKYE